MRDSQTPLSKKQLLVRLLIVVGLLVVLAILYFVYRQTSLWKPKESLFTLLPQDPICYVSVKDLADAVGAFNRSQFVKRTAQMPILTEIQQHRWWRLVVYQKQLWEYSIGGVLDLNKINGYFGEEAILALYRRDDEVSFLLISEVGAKEKLEIAAITATDLVNPTYKRLQEDYSGFTINTITGYPRDFSYAFIGKIGLLTLSQSLIKDTIDIYAKRKQGFSALHPMHQSLRKGYNSDGSTAFVDFPRLINAFESACGLQPLLKDVDVWTFSNRYKKGTLRSRHRIKWRTDRKPSDSQEISQDLLSVLPGTTALADINHDIDLSEFWKWLNTNLPMQRGQSEVDLSRHLGGEFTLALIGSSSESAIVIPSVVLAIPITDQAGLEADLLKLVGERIVVNRKQLQFPEPQDYQGVKFQPVQLPLGFLFALKGGYAIVNNHWIISATIPGLKSVIDASVGTGTTLAHTEFPAPSNQPKSRHVLIQPNLFIPELKRLVPLVGLIAPASGDTFDPLLTQHVIDNISPLETLGPVLAGVDFDGEGVNVEVQVVVSENKGISKK